MADLNAWNDIVSKLESGENIEWIIFGNWGGSGSEPESGAYCEPNPPPVPVEKRGIILDAGEAESFMHGWSFFGGFGTAKCYAVRIWTNRRIFWVTQYDGSTRLSSTRRHPENHMPSMPGG